MADDPWNLTNHERERVVKGVADGLSSLCFARGRPLRDAEARPLACDVEMKAFSRAKVESQTTSGHRPRSEVESAYLRAVGQLLFEAATQHCRGSKTTTTSLSDDTFDLSTSGREFVTKDLAESYLMPLMDGSGVRKIKFSTKSIGYDAAPVVASAIQAVRSTLRVADMSDIIAGRPEKEVLAVLRAVAAALASCQLESLDVSDNALGEKGLRALEAVLASQTQLRELHLRNIGCSVHACRAVQELVQGTSLRVLVLFNNMSDNEGAAHIARLLERNPDVEELHMVSSRVGVDGGAALLTALTGAAGALRVLDLSDNPMEPSISGHLVPALRAHAQLTCLKLNDVCLGDEGAAALAEALCDAGTCPALAQLELALNEITPASSAALAAALATKAPTLERLNLAENELECAGAVHIAAGLHGAAALRELDCRTNQIGRVGAVALVCTCCRAAQQLQRLDLNDNCISADGVSEITDRLQRAYPGRRVLGDLDENDEDGDPKDGSALDAASELDAALAEAIGKLGFA